MISPLAMPGRYFMRCSSVPYAKIGYMQSELSAIMNLSVPTVKEHLNALEKAGLVYKAFGKMKGTPDEDITTIVDINEAFDLKVQALKMHKTQRKDVERFLKRTSFVDLKKEFFELISENSI